MVQVLDLRPQLAQDLEETRARTWHLIAGLSEDDLSGQACEYLSPPVWDLGHIANFEERWLVQALADQPPISAQDADTYNATLHPRTQRAALPARDRSGCRQYMDEVRAESLRILNNHPFDNRLTAKGFLHRLLTLHEQQHQETLLQTIQMVGAAGRYELPAVRRLPEPGPLQSAWCDVPAGPFEMGRYQAPGVYDNEAQPHPVTLPKFQMARYPVTCGDYLEFMDAGGYDNSSLWSQRGRAWLDDEPHHAPLYWRNEDGWVRYGPGCRMAVADWPDVILSHISYFEAEAYASWRGARLPSEAEWEKAARWDPAGGVTRNLRGDGPATTDRANIDQLAFAPSRVGAYPDGASEVGCEHMIGDVWEWTSSRFEAYPGFDAYPYPDYSEPFFGGDYRVLRGGSWATRSGCATGTFRNWDHPYRRQIFSGIRLAR